MALKSIDAGERLGSDKVAYCDAGLTEHARARSRFDRKARSVEPPSSCWRRFLLIEIAESSLEYDRGEKAELYAAAGVEDYWIVNLAGRCVEAHRDPRGGRYQSVESFSAGAEVRPRAFPELALPAALLFPAR